MIFGTLSIVFGILLGSVSVYGMYRMIMPVAFEEASKAVMFRHYVETNPNGQ